MGDKEQYTETKYTLKSVTFAGAYNQDGDKLQMDIDTGKLELEITKLL